MFIDIMANKGIQQPYFVSDNTAAYKPLLARNGYTGLVQNAYNSTMFTKIDHFTILSIGLSLPLGYQLFNMPNDEPLKVELSTREVISGDEHLIDIYYVPFDSYELSINKFYDLGTSYSGNFELLLKIVETDGILSNVSCINAPAILQNLEISAFMFCKIMHTKSITTIP